MACKLIRKSKTKWGVKEWMSERPTLCVLVVMQQLVIKYSIWPCA